MPACGPHGAPGMEGYAPGAGALGYIEGAGIRGGYADWGIWYGYTKPYGGRAAPGLGGLIALSTTFRK